jgi:hypothetical protein
MMLQRKHASTNKADSHDITEILLKVALNTTKPTKPSISGEFSRASEGFWST